MAFNLYLAGSYSTWVDEELQKMGANRLASQLNDRNLIERWLTYIKEVERRKLFVDSGAFSAHTKGKEVNVDEYIEYLNERQGLFEVIAQVDKIPGEFGKKKTRKELEEAPELSWENYLYMRERVIDYKKLTPIFHQGEDFKHLHRMLEWVDDKGEHIPYIGISPANDLNTKEKVKWFENVFRIIRDSSNPKVKTHAFGMTSLKVLEQYPFYSADSTSWLMTSANGSIMTSNGLILISDVQEKNPKHINHMSKDVQEKIKQEVEGWGYDLEEAKSNYKIRGLINASYLMNWAKNYKFIGKTTYQRRLF